VARSMTDHGGAASPRTEDMYQVPGSLLDELRERRRHVCAAQEAPAPEGLRAARAKIAEWREAEARDTAIGDWQMADRWQRLADGAETALALAATPPTPAEPPRPQSLSYAAGVAAETWRRAGEILSPDRAEARPPEGLDAAALGRVLAGYRERDGRYTPPLTTTEPVRLMGPQEWAREIAARLSAGGAE
jgi:hypothetical protein